MEDVSVAVAGGGLAGLVAARHLADAGGNVTLFERCDEIGGRVRTREVDGFQVDRGFQVLFTAYPAARRELDYDALDLRAFTPGVCIARDRTRSILSDPLRDPRRALESAFNREITLGDKIRTLRLRKELRDRSATAIFGGPDETIESYLRERGFSPAFVRNFAAPFYGGITLDRSLSTSSRVFEYTFRMLATGRIVLPARGMGAIPEQLAERARTAGATIETNESLTGIDDTGTGVTVETETRTADFDAVVVATDPPTARTLTGVDSIPTDAHGCVTQYYAVPGRSTLPVGKRIVLNAGSSRPNSVVPLSAVAPEYAPGDETLLCATFLDEEDLETPAEALAETTRSALTDWFPERDFGGLEPLSTDRIEFAQFRQPPNCHDRLPDVRAPGGRVYLAGEYTTWSSIQGALASGRTAAEAVCADLS